MQPKQGIYTSEFWLACGTQISAFLVAFTGTDSTAKITTGIVAAMSVAGYLWSRHVLKINTTETEVPENGERQPQ